MRTQVAAGRLPHQHGRLAVGEVGYRLVLVVRGVTWGDDFVGTHQVDELLHALDAPGQRKGRFARGIEEVAAMLPGEDECAMDVLRDAAALDGQAIRTAMSQLLAVGDQLRPGRGRPGDVSLLEERLVVVEGVSERVERYRGRRLAGRPG